MSDVDLSTSLAGIHLHSCVYNASGPRSGTSAALKKIAQSKSAAVLTKSATLLAQTGNPQPRTWHSQDGLASFNSEGLPNQGIDYYLDASTIDDSLDGIDKPYIVSLSGKTLADNVEMLRRIGNCAARNKIAAIELNLACPNVIGKPIIAYDFVQMDDILRTVGEISAKLGLPPLGVKLPPYLDFQHFESAAQVLNKYKQTVRYIASINTVGNALAIDIHSEAPYISSNSGFAGMSGPAVKFTALANVRKFRTLLDPSIDVIGVGGIQSGKDAFEMLLAGATACQVATCHWKEGPVCFDRICDELRAIMKDKGHKSVADIRGKLQDWSKEGAAKSRSKAKVTESAPNSQSKSDNKDAAADANFYKALSVILALLLAAVCAHSWTDARILPSECLL